MALILNIDTAGSTASIALSADGQSLHLLQNPSQKDHAAWLHSAVLSLLASANTNGRNLDAVAVNAGPGSYTGLRVALSSAKGFCYAWKLPLITIPAFLPLAWAARESQPGARYYCPLIDARRMEVFCALYNEQLEEMSDGQALILEEHSFDPWLEKGAVVFTGDGLTKWKTICRHPNALYAPVEANASHLAIFAEQSFRAGRFDDLFYAEPRYIKEFYSPQRH